MNDCVRNWNMDDDFQPFHSLHPTGNQRKSIRPENELVELLWQNGHVVMHSQNTRDPTAATINENRETQRQENPNNSIQQDEQVSWMNYPLDDPLTKDFYSDFFYGMPTSDSLAIDKMSKFGLTEEVNVASNSLTIKENLIPPSTSQTFCSDIPQNFAHFSRPGKVDPQFKTRRELGESSSSMVSKLSGNWGSNQVQKWTNLGGSLSSRVSEVVAKQEDDVKGKLGQSEIHDATTVTSSSGGSGPDVGRTGEKITRIQNQKRKGREDEESESYSEETEYQAQAQSQSLEIGRRPQRSTSARRSRAAEVHNLSERRRRDRINEKMKALQELIPHCNKTDKASMLDEAIEYLKSLQLQVQIMWMGSGMAPMVFPIAQKYISLMGRATDQDSIPAITGHAQIPRAPMPNQPLPSPALINQAVASPPVLNPQNFPNIHDAYARYFGLQNTQLPSQQSQPEQPTQRIPLTGSDKPANVASSSENFQNGSTG